MSYHDQEQNTNPADGSGKSPGQGPAPVTAGDALPVFERMQPWGPQDILPEDYPEIDPDYLRPDLVSPVALPPSQSGIPPEAWMPAEWQRKSSSASVVEPNSVVEDNGRTYHGYKVGKYYLPNDAAEQDRLDGLHYSSKLMLHNRLHLAPIQSPKRVLDLATGTGIWVMEFGQEHPECEVVGTDLSKIQPEHPPENIQFIRDDAEEPWEFGPEKFDFIHARYVCTCFDKPKAVMKQAFDNLKPGGWVEYQDSALDILSMDGSTQGTTVERWGELLTMGAAANGRDLRVSRNYKHWLEEIGFVDVTERKIAGPIGPWCKSARQKDMGRVMARGFYDNVTGLSYKLFKGMGFTEEQIEDFATRFRADLVSPAIHAYFPM
ncbi:S-adenosyl-L-methionine-dependent methyltransferase [Apiospora arundinis]